MATSDPPNQIPPPPEESPIERPGRVLGVPAAIRAARAAFGPNVNLDMDSDRVFRTELINEMGTPRPVNVDARSMLERLQELEDSRIVEALRSPARLPEGWAPAGVLPVDTEVRNDRISPGVAFRFAMDLAAPLRGDIPVYVLDENGILVDAGPSEPAPPSQPAAEPVKLPPETRVVQRPADYMTNPQLNGGFL